MNEKFCLLIYTPDDDEMICYEPIEAGPLNSPH